jgi:alpha-galactosidase
VLQVGNLPTVEQNRAHFGAWCVISAPLYLGFDLRNRSLVDAMMPIIGNAEAIAVNQQYAVSALPARSRESLLVLAQRAHNCS